MRILVNSVNEIISNGKDIMKNQLLDKHDKKDMIKKKVIHVQVTLLKYKIFENFLEERLKNAEICLESFLELEWDKIVRRAIIKKPEMKGNSSSMFKKKTGNHVIQSGNSQNGESEKKEILNDFSVILQPARLVFKILIMVLSNNKNVLNTL